MNQRDELDELLGAYFDGELVNEEQSRVRALLAEEHNQRVVEELEMLHAGIEDLPREKLGSEFPQTVVGEIERRRAGKKQAARLYPRVVVAIATLAAAALVMWMVFNGLRDSSPKSQPITANSDSDQPKDTDRRPEDGTRLVQQNDTGKKNNSDLDKANGIAKTNQSPATDNRKKAPAGLAENDTKKKQTKKKQDIPPPAQKYLFTIELVMTDQGIRSRAFQRILESHDISFQPSLKVNRPLEEQMLESRLLQGVAGKPRQTNERDEVELVYVIADADRVDPMWESLRSTPAEIRQMKFNMAITPGELKIFEQLKRREEANFAEMVKERKELGEKLERARTLALNLALMSKLTRTMAATTKLEAGQIPASPFAPTRRVPKAKKNNRAAHDILNRKKDAQILFIIHHR